MTFSWITNLFRRSPAGSRQASPVPPSALQSASAPRVASIYPPDDPGLVPRTVDDLIGSNESLVDRLRVHAATDAVTFQSRFLDPINRMASQVNILPGSATSVFAGEGGLLRASLELAFYCFQASDGRIFTGAETVEVRHRLEPRWRYVCFLAGLLHPVGIPLSRMVITAHDGREWPKFQFDVTEWMASLGADRLYVHWPDESTIDQKKLLGPSPYSAAIVHKIVGIENLNWLEQGSPELARALFALACGQEAPRIAQEVITVMWNKVRERERLRRPQTYGRLAIGTHLSPHLVDAMRVLVRDGKWKTTVSSLVADATGVYLLWPAAGEEIIQQGERTGRYGWPSSVASLADILKRDGIVDVGTGNDLGTVEVVDKDGEFRMAYKVANPTMVLEGYDPNDYRRKSPVTLTALLERDPLAEVIEKPAPKSKGDKSKDQVAAQSKPTEAAPDVVLVPVETPHYQSELALDYSNTNVVPAASVLIESDSTLAAEPEPATLPSSEKLVLREGEAVKFADLVPTDLRRDLKNKLVVEVLGKVIKAWRARGENSTTMRMTDNGAAFTTDFLATLMRNIPDFVSAMADAGLIYSPPERPGLKVIKVAIPEGSKPKEAVVISRYGCKQLGF